jgi:hypothetical protein
VGDPKALSGRSATVLNGQDRNFSDIFDQWTEMKLAMFIIAFLATCWAPVAVE